MSRTPLDVDARHLKWLGLDLDSTPQLSRKEAERVFEVMLAGDEPEIGGEIESAPAVERIAIKVEKNLEAGKGGEVIARDEGFEVSDTDDQDGGLKGDVGALVVDRGLGQLDDASQRLLVAQRRRLKPQAAAAVSMDRDDIVKGEVIDHRSSSARLR